MVFLDQNSASALVCVSKAYKQKVRDAYYKALSAMNGIPKSLFRDYPILQDPEAHRNQLVSINESEQKSLKAVTAIPITYWGITASTSLINAVICNREGNTLSDYAKFGARLLVCIPLVLLTSTCAKWMQPERPPILLTTPLLACGVQPLIEPFLRPIFEGVANTLNITPSQDKMGENTGWSLISMGFCVVAQDVLLHPKMQKIVHQFSDKVLTGVELTARTLAKGVDLSKKAIKLGVSISKKVTSFGASVCKKVGSATVNKVSGLWNATKNGFKRCFK